MKSYCLVLLLALSTSACSQFTSAGRQERVYANQERSYAKYLKKMRGEGQRRQAQALKNAPSMPAPEAMMPSEPSEATETSQEGPQSMPSDSDSQASAATGNN